MDDYIYIFIATISLISISSLSFVIYLLKRGDSKLLYDFTYDKLRRKWHTALFAIAALTLLTIFYQGAMYITSWLPILFDYVGYRLAYTISFFFTVFVGGMLILFISENMAWKSEMDFRNEMVRVLNEAVDDITNHREAAYIRTKLEDEAKKIVSENTHPEDNAKVFAHVSHTLPSRRVTFYQSLAGKVSRLDDLKP